MNPAVSILVPVYNVERYLPLCLEHLVGQTFESIEFICVDDGSTDGSLAILEDYASRDERIRVIHQENAGYGAALNTGFDAALGDYVGNVDPDDFADVTMVERLYQTAVEFDADIVKSNFYLFKDGEDEDASSHELRENLPEEMCGKLLHPSDPEWGVVINGVPSIWSALYRREHLNRNHLRLRETPGSSFQDTAFLMKNYITAESMVLVHDGFVHYRQARPGSGTNTQDRVFNVCDEFAAVDACLDEHPDKRALLLGALTTKRYATYNWNYWRLGWDARREFIVRFAKEFREIDACGELHEEAFDERSWQRLQQVMTNPEATCEHDCAKAFEKSLDWTRKQLADCREALSAANGELLAQSKRMDNLQKRLERSRAKNASLDEKLEKERARRASLKQELDKLRNSRSYRIGLAITAIPRTIKRWLRGGSRS